MALCSVAALNAGAAWAATDLPAAAFGELTTMIPVHFRLPEIESGRATVEPPLDISSQPLPIGADLRTEADRTCLEACTDQGALTLRLARANFRSTVNEPVSVDDTPATYGPISDNGMTLADPDEQRLSFGRQMGVVKWELALALGWMTAGNALKVKQEGVRSFRFVDEGWFGKSTYNLGMDKLAHAWNTYWLSDAIEARIRHKSGADNAAVPAAAAAMGLMLYSELWDAHKKSSGFSLQDVAMNTAGASFSVLRNSVPGLDQKLDFRLLLLPNSDIYTFSGTRHYRQMRFLLALKLSGFEQMESGPLRFVELHAGYYAAGFTAAEERRAEERRQRPFIGIGLNLNELLFGRRRPDSMIGRAARETLQYLQVPYTAYHLD